MNDKKFKQYGYRWVVLGVFMFVNLTIQILWIAYAPITGPAAQFYGVSDLQIGSLSMAFMIAYIPLSLPVAWVIDTYGFKIAVGIGVGMMSIFGILRGLAGDNYSLVLWSTIGIAAAQPFLLNAWTKVPANWFAVEERATAVGLVTLANLLGVALGMVLTPMFVESLSIPTLQLIYGGFAAFSAILFLILARENPPTPPCPPEQQVRALMLDGLKNALKVKSFWFVLLISFIGLGIFNGITTWVESMIRPRGFSPTDAGTLGALMIFGGLIGAVVIPALSDKQRKRQRYMYIALGGAIPGLVGLTFATTSFLLFASAFVMGFFLLSAGPIGFQYGAEIAYPAPEGTSNGLLLMMGQISGIILILAMDSFKDPETGSMTSSLLVLVGLMLLGLLLATRLKESKLLVSGPASAGQTGE